MEINKTNNSILHFFVYSIFIIIILKVNLFGEKIILKDYQEIEAFDIEIKENSILYKTKKNSSIQSIEKNLVYKIVYKNRYEEIISKKGLKRPQKNQYSEKRILFDGLYTRALLGLSTGSNYTKDQDISGSAFFYHLQGAYAFYKDLGLILSLGELRIWNPEVSFGTSNKNDLDYLSDNVSMAGLGLDYFFNLFRAFINFQLVLAENQNSNLFRGLQSKTYGLGYIVTAGKEWWFSKNWGSGVSIFLMQCKSKKVLPNRSLEVISTFFGVAYSFTFH